MPHKASSSRIIGAHMHGTRNSGTAPRHRRLQWERAPVPPPARVTIEKEGQRSDDNRIIGAHMHGTRNSGTAPRHRRLQWERAPVPPPARVTIEKEGQRSDDNKDTSHRTIHTAWTRWHSAPHSGPGVCRMRRHGVGARTARRMRACRHRQYGIAAQDRCGGDRVPATMELHRPRMHTDLWPCRRGLRGDLAAAGIDPRHPMVDLIPTGELQA